MKWTVFLQPVAAEVNLIGYFGWVQKLVFVDYFVLSEIIQFLAPRESACKHSMSFWVSDERRSDFVVRIIQICNVYLKISDNLLLFGRGY